MAVAKESRYIFVLHKIVCKKAADMVEHLTALLHTYALDMWQIRRRGQLFYTQYVDYMVNFLYPLGAKF